ncbi:MAG: alpha/beta hydrolase [Gammaproteobacteria bacterium]|nr:alpha/beta hydrolase [Gammaproteobacteria bacterium]
MQSANLESQALLIGDNRLFGIRTSAVDHHGPIGMVILNAGMVSNAGPYRMSVDIADTAAGLGLTTIRLDQSGKGESPARSKMTPAEAAFADFDDACSHLRQLGITEIILAGLCSGATDALRIAAKRENVIGLILLDGYVRPDLRWRYDRLMDKLQRTAARVRRVASLGLGGTLERLGERRDGKLAAASYNILMDDRSWEASELRNAYLSVLNRNAAVLSIFSGTFYPYSYAGQLSGFLSGGTDLSGLREEYFKESDHLFTLESQRVQLVDTITAWIEAELPVDSLVPRQAS